MKPLHMLMALSFSAFWGANFVAIKMSLESFSPFFQQGLRFFFVSFPLIFFVPRPRHSWKAIFKFSLFLWVFQLSFITLGLKYGVPAGMFSLLLQTKAIVVIILSTLFYHYRPCLSEIVGVILSLTGVAMIAHSIMEEETSAAYLFIIPAVLSVSYASLAFKNDTHNASNPFSITIWCAFIAMIPMFLMSLAVEGPSQALHSLETFTWRSLFALFYTVICATLIATSFYVFLLKRYGPERMIPFNLLIPVFGTFTSALVYKETFTLIQSLAIALILTGLIVNQIRRPLHSFNVFRKPITDLKDSI
jgi:O-acetylserine/cysteine efflux transporter